MAQEFNNLNIQFKRINQSCNKLKEATISENAETRTVVGEIKENITEVKEKYDQILENVDLLNKQCQKSYQNCDILPSQISHAT
jgi:predicted transcriptional regulator